MADRIEEVLLSVRWPDGGIEGMPTRRVAGMLAAALREAGIGDVAEAERRGEGSFWVGGREVTRADYLALTDALQQAMDDAREHYECPVTCELCGERLANTVCERCHGSGCLPNAALAYLECGHCAGAGRIHDGCAEQSYADLLVRAENAERERDEAERRGAVRALRSAAEAMPALRDMPQRMTPVARAAAWLRDRADRLAEDAGAER